MRAVYLVSIVLCLCSLYCCDVTASHYLLSNEPELHMPVKVRVSLIGFAAASDIDTAQLTETLTALYPLHRSRNSTGADLPMHYDVVYEVKKIDDPHYMNMIYNSISAQRADSEAVPMYSVASTDLLMNAYEYIYNDVYKWNAGVWTDMPVNRAEYVVFIVQLDKTMFSM